MKLRAKAQLICLVAVVLSLPLAAQEKVSSAADMYKPSVKQETRVSSSTGAVFVSDTSRPSFGKAFRDMNGLIWSDLLKDEKGAIKLYNDQATAHRDCRLAGGRVPFKKEVDAMLLSLGLGTERFSFVTVTGLEVIENFSLAPFILGDSPKMSMGFDEWDVFYPKDTTKNLGHWRFRKVRVIENKETWAVRCVATAE